MNLKQFNPLKVLNHIQTLEDITKGKVVSPVSVEIDPSNNCNHNCVWCMYKEFKERKREMLPKNIFETLVDDLAKGGVKSVTLTGGGEPLTNPATRDMLYKIKESGMKVALVTNGGLLDDRITDAILDTCEFVRFSLDASTKETHRKLHRPKNYVEDNLDKILEKIEAIVEKRKSRKKNTPTIGAAFLVHKDNFHEIYDLAKKMKVMGVDYSQFRPVFIPGVKLSDTIWNETQYMMEKALTLIDSTYHVFPIMHRFDEVAKENKTFSICLGHNLLGVVGADSNLYVCCQLRGNPEFSYGSLKEKRFFEIWKSKKRQEVIKKIDINKCPPCRYSKYNEILEYLAEKGRPHKEFL